MKLYILRHGDAGQHGDPKFKNDDERPLTAKGIERTKQLAAALREWEVSFDAILSSPLVRARQTAEIVARCLRQQSKLKLTDHLALDGDIKKLVSELNSIRPRPETVLLVGHEPYLSGLISLLCTGGPRLSLMLKKGALCRLEVQTLTAVRCASLEWLLPPRLFSEIHA